MNNRTYAADVLLSKPWLQFSRPNVRDLAFALGCPPILLKIPDTCYSNSKNANNKSLNDNNLNHKATNHQQPIAPNITLPDTQFWHQHYVNYLPRLKQLDKNPKPLNRFLGNHLKSFRLGFRFEALLLFWLQDTDYHHYRVIAHNIQIFKGNTTLSELDFLIHNTQTNQVEHWEVSIKFFLGEMPFTPAHWKGLRGDDNLEKKLKQMLTKPFSHHTVNIDGVDFNIDKRMAILKGRFYEPAHQQAELQNSMQNHQLSWLNPKLPRGTWYQHVPITSPINDADTELWRAGRRVEWFTKRDCYDAFDKGTAPKQIADGIYAFAGRRQPLIWQTGLYFKQGQAEDHSIMLRL